MADFLNTSTVNTTDSLCGTTTDTATADVTINPESAALSVTKAGPTDVCSDTPISYTITVSNNANVPKTTTLTDTITGPIAVADVSAAPIGAVNPVVGGSTGNVTVTWTNIIVPAKGSVTTTVRVSTSCSNVGTLTDQAMVTISGTPIYSDTVTTIVRPVVDLAIDKSKTSPPDPVYVGDKVVYKITVTNLGPCDATGVYVDDTPPATATVDLTDPDNAGWSVVSPGVYRYVIGNLAAGASVPLTFAVVPTVPTTP